MSKKVKKSKNKSNKSTNKEIIEDIVDDIYADDDSSNVLIQPASRKSHFMLYTVFIVIISFLGGVVGELTVNNYLYHTGNDIARVWEPVVETDDPNQQIIVFEKEKVEEKNLSQTKLLINTASQAVVGIYLKRGGTALVDQLYRSSDKVGNALVLTSDGWLATTVTGMPTESGKELTVITADNKVLPIEKIVLDEASQIVFVKVAAENLKVVKFAEESDIYTGLNTVMIGQTINSQISKVLASTIDQVNYRNIDGFANYFQSTEKYGTFLTIKDKLDNTFAGGPLVDMEGGIIGLYLKDGVVVPASHFVDTFNSFLRYEEIDRPFVGISYIDLAHTIGLPENISEGLQSGALVFGDKDHDVIAVAPQSPAATAGIVFGDIITKVNNDAVDAKYSLTELLQQYKTGDVVKFTIQNAGVIREVELVLVEK